MAYTIKDVAKLAGVSKSTVSQYLNKRYNYMSKNTKEKIKEAIKELNYQPNQVARSLTQKKTFIIGVLTSTILGKFTTEIVRAIEDECQKYGFQIIVCNTDDIPQKEKNYVESMVARQIDGLIIFPTEENKNLYQGLIKQSYPIVFIDRKIDDINTNSVLLDNEMASKQAVDHFVSMGHKKIAILTFPLGKKGITTRKERLSGYKDALKNYKIKVNKDYIKNALAENMEEQLNELFALDTPPTAILATNDMILEKILIYAKKKNYTIPEDFSLIGIDDVSFASFNSPPITTIAQPTFEMGKIGAKLLLDKINNSKKIENQEYKPIRLAPTLYIRESVKKID